MSTQAQECAICFEDIEKDRCSLENCTHVFHYSSCLLPWSRENNTCPCCRTTFIRIKVDNIGYVAVEVNKVRNEEEEEEEDEVPCHACGEAEGLLVFCDGDNCNRVFHPACVNLAIVSNLFLH